MGMWMESYMSNRHSAVLHVPLFGSCQIQVNAIFYRRLTRNTPKMLVAAEE